KVCDSDCDPASPEELCGMIHPVEDIEDHAESGERADEMTHPRAAALSQEVVVDDCQVQEGEAGEGAEVDHAGEIIDAAIEEEAHQKRHTGHEQRADIRCLEARMHGCEHPGKLSVARHRKEHSRD